MLLAAGALAFRGYWLALFVVVLVVAAVMVAVQRSQQTGPGFGRL